MLHRRWTLTCAALLATLLAAPTVHAQAISSAFAANTAAPAASLGPTLDMARAGVHAPATINTTHTIDPNVLAPERQHMGKSVALMIVGGAALVTGAIIGGAPGALVAVAGAGVGLYGLYLYLQ